MMARHWRSHVEVLSYFVVCMQRRRCRWSVEDRLAGADCRTGHAHWGTANALQAHAGTTFHRDDMWKPLRRERNTQEAWSRAAARARRAPPWLCTLHTHSVTALQ